MVDRPEFLALIQHAQLTASGSPPTDPVFGLYGELAKFGLMGVILALLWLMYTNKDKALLASLEARVAENKAVATVAEGVQHALSSMTLATENRTKATEAVASAQMATAQALQTLIREIERIQDSVQKQTVEANRQTDSLMRSLETLTRQIEALREHMKAVEVREREAARRRRGEA